MTEAEERAFVERLKARDEAAFNELVRLYERRIFRVVYRMLGNMQESEDLTQEVFVTVFKRIDGFRGESKLSTWLYRVATNHCRNRIKYLKRRAQDRKRELDEIADGRRMESATMSTSAQIDRPDHRVEAAQLEGIIKQAISELPEEQRTLVVLREIENLTYEEMQEITGLNPGTVKSRLHRARLALVKRVRELQGEEEVE